MSQGNVDLVKKIYEALNKKDALALAAVFDSKIEIQQSSELPWGGDFHGLIGAHSFFGTVMSYLDSQVTIERFLDAGESVAAIGRTQGTVKLTGKAFDVPLVHVWGMREGRVTQVHIYIDNPGMRAALEG